MEKGRVVITGASRGIGRALALRFAQEGYRIIACARMKTGLDALADEIRKRHAFETVVVTCDLGTPEGRRELEQACAGAGAIVGLINNAGFGIAGSFGEQDRARETAVVRLNVEAVVDLCHAFLPRLHGQPGAFIVNVASTAAFQPVPLFATYAASKAFVLSFSEALADELAPKGVHVMALCPGLTETGFQKEADLVLAGSWATAEAVADFALRALRSRKRVAIHGVKNRALAFGNRLATRKLSARVARKAIEPWFAGRPRSS